MTCESQVLVKQSPRQWSDRVGLRGESLAKQEGRRKEKRCGMIHLKGYRLEQTSRMPVTTVTPNPGCNRHKLKVLVGNSRS